MLDINPLLVAFCKSLFTFFMAALISNALHYAWSPSSVCSFIVTTSGGLFKKSFPTLKSERYHPYFLRLSLIGMITCSFKKSSAGNKSDFR